MLALRGMYQDGKIELLDAPPGKRQAMVAVIFLDVEAEQVEEGAEALLLSRSPVFQRLVQHAAGEVQLGNTRPVQDLLDELPD